MDGRLLKSHLVGKLSCHADRAYTRAMRLWWLSLLTAGAVCAQGTDVKAKASDYPSTATLPQMTLGAEFMVHSIAWHQTSYVAEHYLVVEVAVFPSAGHTVSIQPGQFGLRLNGKRDLLRAQSAGSVAASVKYPDWERPGPHLEAAAGIGDAGITTGQPRQVGRFPGDPTVPTRAPLPRIPGAGEQAGVSKAEELPVDEVVSRAALPAVETRFPVSGYLYFPYRGRIKSLKSIELVCESPAGQAVLSLR